MNKDNNNRKNDNYIVLQITLFDVTGRYKPISTLISVPSVEEYKKNSVEYKRQAVQKICNQRFLSGKELIALGYKKIKVRNYSLLTKIKRGDKWWERWKEF